MRHPQAHEETESPAVDATKTVSVSSAARPSRQAAAGSFLFLGANTPWVLALADALAERHEVHAVQFYDWRTYRRRSGWPESLRSSSMRRTLRVMPPGYAGRVEPLFRPLMQRMVRKWSDDLRSVSSSHPWVITPYPYLAPWVRGLPGERLIYYNLDDYPLYQPSRREQITAQEAELIERAALTLCLSRHQTEILRSRHPGRADAIKHFPLGVTAGAINPEPNEGIRAGIVGYVGNMSDRVDWRFVYEVADRCPDLTFVFVGDLNKYDGTDGGWKQVRGEALALPNVRHVGPVPQDDVRQYYWSFAVNWIPYAVNHPFNRASCPTKIMDGLAAGRPLVSTAVPECTLYSDWISIAHAPEEAVKAIRQSLREQSYARADEQLDFVRGNTWLDRADRLETWLADHEA